MSEVLNIKTEQFLKPLKEFEKKQLQLVKDNPYIEISDTKTFEAAKKSRTALVKGRTELQGQQKTINNSVNSIKSVVKEETERLIQISVPAEEKQQIEVKRFEAIQDEKRIERERIAAEKKEEIQNKIDEIISDWTTDIEKLQFEGIELFQEEMKKLDELDTSSFEDLEIYFSGKVASLKNSLEIKISSLKKDQELLVSQSLNRFNEFKSYWMERLMDATIDNIHQLNLDFDSQVPDIDPDTFFTYKDQFLQEADKLRSKLVDTTETLNTRKESLKKEAEIEEKKGRLKGFFKLIEGMVDDMTHNSMMASSDTISKSLDEVKALKGHENFKDLIDLNISNINNKCTKRQNELVEQHTKDLEAVEVKKKEDAKTEKERLATEKKASATEIKRQKELKPYKEAAKKFINLVLKGEHFGFDNKEIQLLIADFDEEILIVQKKYTELINNL